MTGGEQVLAAALSVLGWAALRGIRKLDNVGKKVVEVDVRLVRLEEKLDNGLNAEVRVARRALRRISRLIHDHMNGEERRIVDALKRDPNLRTRRTDT
jgi:hypothetical protein